MTAGQDAPHRLRLRDRLNATVPAPSTIIIGSVVWGLLMAVAVAICIYWRNELILHSRVALISLFFFGPALGFGPGLWLAQALSLGAGTVRRFFIGMIAIALVAHATTGLLFGLQYRMFYAHWHAPFPSLIWCLQFMFTLVGALYQFAVDSLYFYYPLVPLLFVALGIWFARRPH